MSKYFSLLPCFLFLLLSSCNDNADRPAIPNVLVNEQINVRSAMYPRLQQDGGYAYIAGGYKGIMVVRQSADLYYAFERTCPYDPAAACSQIEADDSNLFIIDKCCGSQFSFQGNVMAGPAVYGLRAYKTSLVGSTLYISN
ncbi:Rieske (2Fe-2S) protein [Botryobacter ruber]|uniref:hypothetical protein n=1 Tax=Botryobacter ruber TaxID=2171629 RepID=UPI000E0A0F89|nr:hypothetical protein [Botryobacter ruber]